MKKQDVIQIKSLLSSLPANTRLHLITWLNDNLQTDTASVIDTSPPELCCPHCHSEKAIRWGRDSDIQRYRCKDCGKTFNSLTGSPLARLHYHQKWFDYLRCMQEGLTLRESARRTGIDLTTAFRWRHRFLASAAANNINPLSGIIEADETFFPESSKGKRNIIHRKARKRGGEVDKRKKQEQVPVVIACDRQGRVSDCIPPEFDTENIHRFLEPIADKDSILCTDGACWYRTFASEHGMNHYRLIALDNQRVIDSVFHIQHVNGYISRLKGWMKRFHGVGTAYLPNYLAWRRLFETTVIDVKVWLQIALRHNQHTLQT
ncbi:IS1595 family transposase [Klebsiella sp. WOUb02]|uniref:IS1595 family transposase n=1 Tax=Klebsiella sp. WOUb02 TaxID=3161071 RepID=UPI003CF039E7